MLMEKTRRLEDSDELNGRKHNSKRFRRIQVYVFGSTVYLRFAFSYFLYICTWYHIFLMLFILFSVKMSDEDFIAKKGVLQLRRIYLK